MSSRSHAALAENDTAEMRALREDYDEADKEIQELKAKLGTYEALYGPISETLWRPLLIPAWRRLA